MLFVGSIDQFLGPRRPAAAWPKAWPKRISHPQRGFEARSEEAKGIIGVCEGTRLSPSPGPHLWERAAGHLLRVGQI